MRIVIELKRGVIPKVALNKLYKHTAMQTTFGVNAVALVDGVPRPLPLTGIIDAYVRHQRDVVVRRTKHELYGKIVAKSSKYHAHDEKGEYKMGDVVEIAESRPISKTKSWVVTRLVQKAQEV
jgi:ribosomal protein S17